MTLDRYPSYFQMEALRIPKGSSSVLELESGKEYGKVSLKELVQILRSCDLTKQNVPGSHYSNRKFTNVSVSSTS